MSISPRFLVIKTLALGLFFQNVAWCAEISEIRFWRAPDHTRVVLDLTDPVDHHLLILENPDRIVVDLKKASLSTTFEFLELDKTPIKKIRSGKRVSGDLRIVLDLKTKVHPRSFFLKANNKASDRLVIDLFDRVITPVSKKNKISGMLDRRDILIAIDAGHGGEDPGAIGPRGIQEKKIVLSISKILSDLFDKEQGFSSVLVRSGDYYVSLKQRRNVAREKKADAFLSIHADAFKSKSVSGVSVYALSISGASSTAASYLAQRENAADLVGGVSLSDKDNLLASVLADLSMTSTLDASLNLGERILESMGKSSRLHKKSVEQAAFAVLKSPDIPSVLIETGFISNPAESRKLSSESYQSQMARNIFKGVLSWFSERPPPGTLLAWRRQMNLKSYTIVSGDTLSAIAMQFSVSVELLKELNDLEDSSIYAGKSLKIPMEIKINETD